MTGFDPTVWWNGLVSSLYSDYQAQTGSSCRNTVFVLTNYVASGAPSINIIAPEFDSGINLDWCWRAVLPSNANVEMLKDGPFTATNDMLVSLTGQINSPSSCLSGLAGWVIGVIVAAVVVLIAIIGGCICCCCCAGYGCLKCCCD